MSLTFYGEDVFFCLTEKLNLVVNIPYRCILWRGSHQNDLLICKKGLQLLISFGLCAPEMMALIDKHYFPAFISFQYALVIVYSSVNHTPRYNLCVYPEPFFKFCPHLNKSRWGDYKYPFIQMPEESRTYKGLPQSDHIADENP